MRAREIAKFFAGFAANQVLTHGAFALSGVQFMLFGIHYDRRLNSAAVLAWAVALALLVYYAWIRR